MHELQKAFATEEGEAAWTQDMHALFGAGAFDEAEALLAEALTALDTELAWTCLELPREGVVLSGWDELGEAIAMHEGDPVTGVTIAIANEGDRAFEKGQTHHPYVLLGIYTDEAYAFSSAVHWEMLDECHAEMPAWAGREEDIEVHMDIDGLDHLNTRLVHHKQRHFFREGEPASAPLRYVEFVLGCWWRALRWHQAVATECAIRGLPRAIPVVAGMVDLRPEAVAIHDSGRGAPRLSLVVNRTDSGAAMLGSLGEGFIQRKAVEEEPETAAPTVADLRRRAQEDGELLDKPQRSLWARIFGKR
ncbi:MAG TPA: hypothetical protein VFS87_04745 [Qipengyuania sp.]|nr:hypothetical protein [Qipengyuania sp.]